MSTLYTDLSEIYEGMYQTFIDYEEELGFYSGLLKKYQCHSVLEAGCGTGNLAPGFAAIGVDYSGMDLSEPMLTRARRNNPSADFLKADMRNFHLLKPKQSCLITGRSISYLVTDEDVYNAFRSIYMNLTKPGLLCFDFIDASKFIPSIENGKMVTHKAMVRDKIYHRKSFWKINEFQKGAFDWESVFYEEVKGNLTKLGDDQSTIRAFWIEEMRDFLKTSEFKVEEIIPRPSYAFDTIVMVAGKIIA